MGKGKTRSVGLKILTIFLVGLAIPISILIGSYLYSMDKVAGDARHIVSEKLLAEVKNGIRSNVESVVSTAEAFYSANKGKMPENELVELIFKQLELTRYGEAGYFFGYSYEGIRMLAPENKANVGKNMWDVTDPNGVKVIQEIIAASKNNGGFVAYTWLNPATNKNEMKISYAKSLKLGEKEFAFGTGTYVPMIEASKRQIDQSIGKTKADIAKMVILSSLLVTALVIAFIYFFTTRAIIKPVKRLVDISNSLAEGNLNVSIDIENNDEIGLLAGSFHKMTQNMNEVLTYINAAAEQVASGSRQVSDSSVALSEGATEQASAIQQLTASIEEIASQTKLNAGHAEEANILAENAKANAARGNEHMQEMLNAMDNINTASANISKIIKVIDEIAFQTNILALNAAVEAARAGQHGKGFAVVAEEVRNLAARSANAARETTEMIEGSIRQVGDGTRIANQTAAALRMIVEDIGKVASIIGDITRASNEQAIGIAQINQGIMQVSQVVQSNSATSQQGAAASEELAGQAEMLKEQAARFKLRKTDERNAFVKGMPYKRHEIDLG